MLMEASSVQIIAQVIGVIAAAFGIFGYLLKQDKRLKLLMTGQNIWLCLHFALMGAWTASLITLMTALRNYLSLKTLSYKFTIFFIFSYLVIGVMSYDSWLDILPVTATVTSTYAYFHLSQEKLRFVLLFGTML